ncbi:hypothetical protein KY333_04895 [Candidatus Woesearchaeota archaeon]|nr:hypothetical protein [Candidatus Woesearchaeota archaeon]MBW2993844.1 hypothetical protein [Candidatus Woesearchaeota archaeon]
MGLIKSPISLIKFGVKAVTNTAFYGLALYGAINVSLNTYSAVSYLKSLQKPETKQEIVETTQMNKYKQPQDYVTDSIDKQIRTAAAEAIMGESIDKKIDQKVEEKLSRYLKKENLLDLLKKDQKYTEYSTD